MKQMRKVSIGLLSIGLLAISLTAQAQKIGKIKDKARQSSNNRKSDRRSSGSGGSSNSGSNGGFNGAACFDIFTGCLDLLIAITPDEPPSNNRSQTYTPLPREKEPVVVTPPPTPPPPTTTTPTPPVNTTQAMPVLPPKSKPGNYFQLKASYGFLPNNYEVFRPGVRVRFGNKHGFGMAIDYRYNFLREKILGDNTSYFTHDIQVLQFAPETKGDVEIRVGLGLMVDEFKELYPEVVLGFNALADQTKWNFGSEFRFAPNIANGGKHPARIEWGAHVQYALVNQPKFKLYGGLRSKVAKYFGEDIWSIGLGFNMRIY